jgi:hypothetical protein
MWNASESAIWPRANVRSDACILRREHTLVGHARRFRVALYLEAERFHPAVDLPAIAAEVTRGRAYAPVGARERLGQLVARGRSTARGGRRLGRDDAGGGGRRRRHAHPRRQAVERDGRGGAAGALARQHVH